MTTVEEQAAVPTKTFFKYSEWLHIGSEPESDEAVEAGAPIEDYPGEFHAWCRLPNQFQHRAIRDKAMAAKARVRRQLRDTQTDAYEILEDALNELALSPSVVEDCVNELTAVDWLQNLQRAQTEVKNQETFREPTAEDPDPEPERPFEHIEEDEKRYAELQQIEESERPNDEWVELTNHMNTYNEALEKAMAELEAPRRAELEQLGVNELIDQVRAQRIERASVNEFMHYYSAWQWIAGTLDKPHGKQLFHDIHDLEELDEEIIERLRDTFTRLEGLRGNL